MSGQDETKTVINRLSLVMTIPEDMVKIMRARDYSPAENEMFLKLHNQQVELEKAINQMNKTMLQMSMIIDAQANYATALTSEITNLAQHVGYAGEEQVTSEDVGQH